MRLLTSCIQSRLTCHRASPPSARQVDGLGPPAAGATPLRKQDLAFHRTKMRKGPTTRQGCQTGPDSTAHARDSDRNSGRVVTCHEFEPS